LKAAVVDDKLLRSHLKATSCMAAVTGSIADIGDHGRITCFLDGAVKIPKPRNMLFSDAAPFPGVSI
jgi:hypothetical protein